MANILDKLTDTTNSSDTLLSTLLACEDVLDANDVYVAPGWFAGEVVAGPNIRRHWVSISLLYPFDNMPDPRIIPRLLKLGMKVEYNKVQRAGTLGASEFSAVEEKDEVSADGTYWMVNLTYPRKLLDVMKSSDDIDLYDDEEDAVDADSVETARDTGLDDESAYQTDEQVPMEDPTNAPAS